MEHRDLGVVDKVGVVSLSAGSNVSSSAILKTSEDDMPADDVIMQIPTAGSDVDRMR